MTVVNVLGVDAQVWVAAMGAVRDAMQACQAKSMSVKKLESITMRARDSKVVMETGAWLGHPL